MRACVSVCVSQECVCDVLFCWLTPMSLFSVCRVYPDYLLQPKLEHDIQTRRRDEEGGRQEECLGEPAPTGLGYMTHVGTSAPLKRRTLGASAPTELPRDLCLFVLFVYEKYAPLHNHGGEAGVTQCAHSILSSAVLDQVV